MKSFSDMINSSLGRELHIGPIVFAADAEKVSRSFDQFSVFCVDMFGIQYNQKMLNYRGVLEYIFSSSDGAYLGFVKEQTTFSISRGSGDISHVDGGSYQVSKEVSHEAI